MGHSPYRQWFTYRKQRLILVASESDEASPHLGEAIAQALATHLPESKAMVATTRGTLDIVKLLKSNQLDVALLTSDEASEARNGAGRFSGWAVPLRTLAVVEIAALHLATRSETGIRAVPDLRGKTVATGSPESRAEALTVRVLEAYGLDAERDVRRVPLARAEALTALRDKRIDALGWVDLVPNQVIPDKRGVSGMALRFLDHTEALPKIEAKHGREYRQATIPHGAYPDLAADIGVVGLAYLVVCRDDFPARSAYQIAKTLSDHRHEGSLAPLDLTASPASVDRGRLFLHPGALQFHEGGPLPSKDAPPR